MEYLREIPHAPSVGIHNSAPAIPYVRAEKIEAPPDVRMTDAQRAAHVEHEGELFDSEKDQAGEENGVNASSGSGPAPMSIVSESEASSSANSAVASSTKQQQHPAPQEEKRSTSSPSADVGEPESKSSGAAGGGGGVVENGVKNEHGITLQSRSSNGNGFQVKDESSTSNSATGTPGANIVNSNSSSPVVKSAIAAQNGASPSTTNAKS